MRTSDISTEHHSGCPMHNHSANQNRNSTRKTLTDEQVVEEIKAWMQRKLPCVAGRREFNRGRYMIRVVNRETVKATFEEFKEKLATGEAIACLYVFNEPSFYEGRADVSSAFNFLAGEISPLGDKAPDELANGEALTNSVELTCPVTGKNTVFDDFECIAFCPQSSDPEDPLYDPLMYAPFPCVNMSSDVFAFSSFVSDNVTTMLGHRPHEETEVERLEAVFRKCVNIWQRVATTTIRNYEAVTDVSICPVHVADDETHWIAGHKDPAFAEQVKEAHAHELPVVYGSRIVDNWLASMHGKTIYDAGGQARDGVPIEL